MVTKTLHTFHIEITDTYGREANYSWVKRTRVKAISERGAIAAYARENGAGWRKSWDNGMTVRYDLKGACVCAFVTFSE